MSENNSSKVAITVALIGLFGTLGAVILNKYLPELPKRAQASSIESVADEQVSDPEGQVYPTVRLVGKRWLAKNLNYYVSGALCYDADPANCEQYGKLYTWEAAQTACASLGAGWRVPTDEEWKELLIFYGGYEENGPLGKDIKIGNPEKALKALEEGGLTGYNVSSNGGWFGTDNEYHNFEIGSYWSATELYTQVNRAWSFDIYSGSIKLIDMEKQYALSCRCVQDIND